MSLPADPAGPGGRPISRRTRYELRERGRALGFDFHVGIRMTTLADEAIAAARRPQLREVRRLAPPDASVSLVANRDDAVGRWESEGGAVD